MYQSCIINIMGNQLCPGSTKDFIQGFRQLEKGQKQYHPLFKCCMNNETVQAQEIQHLIDYFQERDKLNQQTTLQNSKIHHQTLIREENPDQVQFQRHPKYERHQVHSPLVKEVVDLAFPDGWRYKGEAIGFIPEGQGQEYGPHGEHFIGLFLKGKKQGYGTYQYANGTVYKGEFKDNMMWGFGRFQFTNGDRFEGHFVKNVREGKGKYILPQPNIQDLLYFQGEYKNDMKNGPGMMKYVGNEVHGFWKDGNYDFNLQSQHNEVY